MSTVTAAFARIEAWLEVQAPALKALLNPPADPAHIAELEQALACRLPDSVREAYALHDGESSESNGLHGTWRWLPLAEVRAVYNEQLLIEAEYHFGDFGPGMIPLMQSGGGDLYYVEACPEPADAACESELIEWWHEQPSREVQAASFAAFWQTFADALEAGGVYVYRPDDLQAMLEADEL